MNLKELWTLMVELTVASMKSRYRKTLAGFIWVILNPILMFGVQSLVFKKFLRIDIPDYLLFLLGGLLPWIFVTTTVQMGTPIFASQGQLLKSFKINPLVLLGAQVMDCFINFLASLFLILLPIYFFATKSFTPLLLIPLALIPLLIGTLCLTMTLCILNIFYKDVNFVVGFVLSLLFFLTPIFYPKEFVPENLRILIYFNPILYLIEPFRHLLYTENISEFFIVLAEGIGAALLLCGLSIYTWKRKVNEFYNRL